jgi:hypothetical protein
MAKIKTHQIKAQELAIRLSRQGMFRTYAEAFTFAKSVYGELREGFTKKPGNRTQQFKNAWQVASDNFVSTKAGQVNRARGNEQFRVWLEELKKEPPEVQDDPEVKRMKGIAERNTGYKGTATRVDLGKGTVPSKNIDTTDMQRVRDLRAQQIQREATTTKTAGLDPSKAPKNLVKAPEQQYPSTTQTPSTAPSKQGQMLKRAEMTDPAHVAESKYERELMRTAMEEGEQATRKKLEKQTGVKHSKSSWTAIWEKMSKAMQEANIRTGGGPIKGGSSPTKNLTGGKLGINDHIKLL